MSGANRLASSDSGGRNTGALTCPSPLAALQDVEGISILLSRTRESLLSWVEREGHPGSNAVRPRLRTGSRCLVFSRNDSFRWLWISKALSYRSYKSRAFLSHHSCYGSPSSSLDPSLVFSVPSSSSIVAKAPGSGSSSSIVATDLRSSRSASSVTSGSAVSSGHVAAAVESNAIPSTSS